MLKFRDDAKPVEIKNTEIDTNITTRTFADSGVGSKNTEAETVGFSEIEKQGLTVDTRKYENNGNAMLIQEKIDNMDIQIIAEEKLLEQYKGKSGYEIQMQELTNRIETLKTNKEILEVQKIVEMVEPVHRRDNTVSFNADEMPDYQKMLDYAKESVPALEEKMKSLNLDDKAKADFETLMYTIKNEINQKNYDVDRVVQMNTPDIDANDNLKSAMR